MVGNLNNGNVIMATAKWTIEDILDPDSDFWIYSEDEIWDWLDRLPKKRQDRAFKNIEDWIDAGDIRMEDLPERPIQLEAPPAKAQIEQDLDKIGDTKRLQSLIESDMISVTMINNMVALSAKNLPKLKEMKALMESHGNKFIEYRFRLNKKEEKVHTYIFIIEGN
tara:strand:+ start:2270 stop:2767 length:498 start_codon:yes stop_codon:yes gene_type:complete